MREQDNHFHQSEVFSYLPEAERVSLLNEASHKILKKGQYLSHQGDVWPKVILVVSGQLRWVMLAASGKEHLLFNIDEGQSFWAHSVFDDEPMPASLCAGKKTEVLIWDRKTVLKYLRKYPDVMWKTTRMLTRIMRHAREIIYSLAFQPVAGRLAALLLDQYTDSNSDQIERDFTLNDLAVRVAATPEVVCRVLYKFQEDGILEITRASINIQDLEALENAKGE
ncbi:MAG: Crp/Fnr family transcriptional regulator [Chloroflexota bacterium]